MLVLSSLDWSCVWIKSFGPNFRFWFKLDLLTHIGQRNVVNNMLTLKRSNAMKMPKMMDTGDQSNDNNKYKQTGPNILMKTLMMFGQIRSSLALVYIIIGFLTLTITSTSHAQQFDNGKSFSFVSFKIQWKDFHSNEMNPLTHTYTKIQPWQFTLTLAPITIFFAEVNQYYWLEFTLSFL